MPDASAPEPRTRCLTELFASKGSGVLIPIIQRDYAQGRPEAAEVRERFLDALHAALNPTAQDERALDLDFVYGYAEEDSSRFVPIDGQQRLTTLFLLHWYLAHLDGEQDHFRSWAVLGDTARFQYAVRTSSDDFLRELATNAFDLEQLLDSDWGQHNALSKTIRNEHWYFRSWELDPTVRACLTMLDAIHQRFGQSTGLYARLIPPNPAITFQFLNLDDFGLGDELYIKMNARGRPLTPFEVFKSEVEKFVADEPSLPAVTRDGARLPMHEHLGIQLDTTWSGLLWELLRSEHTDDPDDDDWPRQLDPQLLNLMRTLAIVCHPDVEATSDQAETVDSWLEDLHNGTITSFRGYERRRAITADWVQTLVKLMDLWSARNEAHDAPSLQTFLSRTAYYDEAAMFRLIREDVPRSGVDTRKPDGAVTYTDLVRFAAYCLFLKEGRDRADLDDWMRVASNLARNTLLERGDSLRRALRGMRRLLPELEGSVLDHLAAGGRLEGFSRQQVREERIKAQLIARSQPWRSLVERAELHPYFQGQVEFLLEFSGVLEAWSETESVTWSDKADKAYREAFLLALQRAEALFAHPSGGLATLSDHLWERALLCQGDYLLAPSAGSSRRSLGINRPDAQVSWKVLLRGDLRDEDAQLRRTWVREVFDHIDPADVTGSLRAAIADGVRDNDDETLAWRKALVAHPHLLDYCRNRWLLWDWHQDDEGYWSLKQLLLIKHKRRGAWQDISTWVLGMKLQKELERGRLAPFADVKIVEGSGSAVRPCIELYLPRKRTATYRLYFFPQSVESRKFKGSKEVGRSSWKRKKLVSKVRKLARAHE